jgi:hypothetical protein
MNVCNNLECLSVAGLSSLVQCLWARPEAYSGATLRLERLAGDKRFSLLQAFINQASKKFYNIGTWRQCYKLFIFVAVAQELKPEFSTQGSLVAFTGKPIQDRGQA